MKLAERIARAQRQRLPRRSRVDYLPFSGGLNTEDSKLAIPPGNCVGAENYEPGTEGGYQVFGGIERYDGRPGPSQLVAYNYLPYRAATTTQISQFQPGQDVAGASSGATGTIFSNVVTAPPRSQYHPYSEDFFESGGYTYINTGLPAVERDWTYPFVRRNKLAQMTYTGAAGVTVIGPQIKLTDTVLQSGSFFYTPGDPYRLSCYVRPDPLKTPRTGVRLAWTNFNNDPTELVGVFLAWGDGGTLEVGAVDSITGATDVRTGLGGFESTLANVDYFGAELVDSTEGVYRVWVQGKVLANQSDIQTKMNLINNTYTANMTDVEGPWVDDPGFFSDSAIAWVTGIQIEKGSHLTPGSVSYVDPFTAGAYGYNDQGAESLAPTGHGYLILVDYSGIFTEDEVINLVATGAGVGEAWEESVVGGIPYDGNPLNDVSNAQRETIQPVPGEGPVLGVWSYNGKRYAFRDKVGGASAGMYEATGVGWSEVTAAGHVYFKNGTEAFEAGQELDGDISGTKATIHRVVLQSGSYAAGDAAGVLIVKNVSDDYTYGFNEGLRVTGGSVIAQCTGVAEIPTFPAGGRYEFRNHNFFGADKPQRMYGVNQVGRAFEYDDQDGILAFIDTGMATDTPTHIAIHEDHLLLSFPGGSIQFSAPGEPLVWRPLLGAGEFTLGCECVGFLEEVQNQTFIFGDDRIRVFGGRSIDSFQLSDYAIEVDCYEGSIQRIGNGVFLGGFGFSTLSASDTFGSFSYNTVSRKIQREIPEAIKNCKASVAFGRESRYRCFLEDGRFWTIGFAPGGQMTGLMPCRVPVPVHCACRGVDDDGTERIFIGSDEYVYELDVGGTMDGDPLYAHIALPFNIQRSPGAVKHWGRAELDAIVEDEISMTVDVYADLGNQSVEIEHDISSGIPGGVWDEFVWDQFTWDEELSEFRPFKIDVQGESISLVFRHVGTGQARHTLRGISFETASRRLARDTYG